MEALKKQVKTLHPEKTRILNIPLFIAGMLAFLCGFSSLCAADTTERVDGLCNKRIVTYYGESVHYDRQDNFAPQNLPLDKLTHVNYAFIDVKADGSIGFIDYFAALEKNFGEPWNSPYKGVIGQFKKLKQQYPRVKFGFSLGGWSRSAYFPVIAADPAKRARLARQAVELLQTHKFDFIDIDWEFPGSVQSPDQTDNPNDLGHPYGTVQDGANYVLLLKELRAELDAAGKADGRYYELSAVLPAGIDEMKLLDIAGISQYLDFMNIMTYDLHGSWENVTGHHAAMDKNPQAPYQGEQALYYGSYALDYYVSHGAPKHKLAVGSPLYSRGWQGVKDDGPIPSLPGLFASATGGANGKRDGGRPAGKNNYYDLLQMEQDPAFVKYRDPATHMPYLYSASKSEFYSYEDTVSAQYRADCVKNRGYGGIIMWQACSDGPAVNQRDAITGVYKDAFYGARAIPAGSTGPVSLPKYRLSGYLHNWVAEESGGYLPLNQVPDAYDVIHIAFVDVAPDGTVSFKDGGSAGPIVTRQWVQDKIARGKIVTFSVGGRNAGVMLDSPDKVNRFATTFIQVAETYGINGIDISIVRGLDAAGDPAAPTPATQGVIDALEIILDHFGSGFGLFLSPESANVMGGLHNYNGAWGVYLPVIEHFKNRLTGLQVQFYNVQDGLFGLDGNMYYHATADNIVAMTDMLVKGFSVGVTGWQFNGLKPEQLLLGLPATSAAAPSGGYLSENDVQTAFRQLTANEKLTSYLPDTNYPDIEGLATWSINWDKQNNWKFSKAHRTFLDSLGEAVPDPVSATPLGAVNK
jgi:GH18 family chitinase